MAQLPDGAVVKVVVSDFRWFREILVRGGDLVEALADEGLSAETRRSVHAFERALTLRDAELDVPDERELL